MYKYGNILALKTFFYINTKTPVNSTNESLNQTVSLILIRGGGGGGFYLQFWIKVFS